MTAARPVTAIVAVVAERTHARARAAVERAAIHADLIEWRLDVLEEDPRPEPFLADLGKPVIATWRLPGDGGRKAVAARTRSGILGACGRAGAAWIDVEVGAMVPRRRGEARILRSLHLPAGDPRTPEAALEELEAAPGDMLKLVLPAGDAAEGLRALALLRDRPAGSRPLALFSAGPRGTATRLLGACLGSALLYAAAAEGEPPAPGMPSLRALVDDFRIHRVRRGDPFVALLGGDLSRSPSARAHNAALDGCGHRTLYVPVPCDDGEAAARALLDLGAHGLAFTRPHKGVAMQVGTLALSPAGATGVANTMYRDGTETVAVDTDGRALADMAHRLLVGDRWEPPEPAPEAEGRPSRPVAVVLGSGATATAAAAALASARYRVHVVARNADRVAALLRKCRDLGAVTDAPAPPSVDLLVNATPLGQREGDDDPSALPGAPPRSRARMDVTYGSAVSPFLRAVPEHRRGTGEEMLRLQAEYQWALWGWDGDGLLGRRTVNTKRAERRQDRIHRVTYHRLGEAFAAAFRADRRRIVLLGMRGAGKTAVGAALARFTGRPLRDTDAMVEATTGRRVYDIFLEDGEPAFRALEREAVAGALAVDGAVVVLGGGAHQHLEARPPESVMVWIRARPETLGRRLRDSGRPSLFGRPPEEELVDLIHLRLPAYEALGEIPVDTDDLTPEEAAGDVLAALREFDAGRGEVTSSGE